MKKTANWIIWSFVIVFGIVLFTFVGSYAYFSMNLDEGEHIKESIVKSGVLSTKFETIDSQYISNEEAKPIEESEISSADYTAFSVSHNETSTVNAKYNIYLSKLQITDNLKNESFKWDLLKDGEVKYSGDFSGADNEELILNESPISLPLNSTDNWKFRVYILKDNSDQSSMDKGSFKARIKVSVVPED